MATRPAAANVLRHTILYRYKGEWCNNVIHSLHAAAITSTRVEADQAAVDGWLATDWRQVSEADAIAFEVRTVDLTTATPTRHPRLQLNWPTGRVGLKATETNVQAMSQAVSLRTGLVGDSPKPPHGRIYHVGGYFTPIVNGLADAAKTAEKVTRFTNLLGFLDGVGNVGDLVVMSYWAGGTRAAPVLRPVPLALPVTRCYVSRRIDTQQRRLPGEAAFATN